MKLTEYQTEISKHSNSFEIFFEELVSYNDKVNLTAITGKHDVYTKHFLDSILSIDAIPIGSSLVDIGAGAGFPSLPIKIVRPDLEVTMVDSLNKRITFLDYITNILNIKTTNVHARAEEFAKNHREIYDVAVARAVAKLNTLLEYLLPLVKVGGRIIAYKGSNFKEELAEATKAIETLGGKYLKTLNFELPNNYGERNIVIIEKIKPTPAKYPRSKNQPKTDPII